MANVLHPATADFPLRHSFVHGDSGDPFTDWIRLPMGDFVDFITNSEELRYCPLRAPRSVPNSRLKPLSDYVTIAVGTGRRYKYAEACWNLSLTEKGRQLPSETQLLSVLRACHPRCGAVRWQEVVTVRDLLDRTVQVCFSMLSTLHLDCCVPPGATSRATPLIGCLVAVKEIGRQFDARPSQIEQGTVSLSAAAHAPETMGTMVTQAASLPVGTIRATLKHSRHIGREDGDFAGVHKMLIKAAADAELGGLLEDFSILEYHPAANKNCADVENEDSWYFIVVWIGAHLLVCEPVCAESDR